MAKPCLYMEKTIMPLYMGNHKFCKRCSMFFSTITEKNPSTMWVSNGKSPEAMEVKITLGKLSNSPGLTVPCVILCDNLPVGLIKRSWKMGVNSEKGHLWRFLDSTMWHFWGHSKPGIKSHMSKLGNLPWSCHHNKIP